jgi:septal ring factor EnvC (AmiA/AmiB activator)
MRQLFTCVRAARILLATVLMVALCSTAFAQTARRDEGAALARLQAALQQAVAERDTLAAENAKLKDKLGPLEKDVTTLRTERESLASRATRAESQLSRTESSNQNLTSNLEATRGRLDEVVGKYRELAENLRITETERGRLSGEVAAGRRELDTCQKANVELAGIAEEALVRYEQKGFFGTLAQKEPFTQITRTRIGNLVDSYRARIPENTIPP